MRIARKCKRAWRTMELHAHCVTKVYALLALLVFQRDYTTSGGGHARARACAAAVALARQVPSHCCGVAATVAFAIMCEQAIGAYRLQCGKSLQPLLSSIGHACWIGQRGQGTPPPGNDPSREQNALSLDP